MYYDSRLDSREFKKKRKEESVTELKFKFKVR